MKLQTITESGLSRVTSKMEGHASGMLTAFRGEFSRRENMQRNQSLKAKLLNAGMHVTPVKGHYPENMGSPEERHVKEESFLVVNPKPGDDGAQLESLLKSLGAEFDQDSIFSKPFGQKGGLIGTSQRENAWPEFDTSHGFDKFKPGQRSDFMTSVKNRPFTFEGFGATLTPPDHRMGKWPLSIAAAQDWREVKLTEAEEKSLEDDEKVVDNGEK